MSLPFDNRDRTCCDGTCSEAKVHFDELYANTHVTTQEEWAARKVQGLIRKKRAWGNLLAMLNDVYEKEYDPETDCWFYVNKVGFHCAAEHHSVKALKIIPQQ